MLRTRANDLFESLVSGGENAIQEMVDLKVREELFLDYKRSADDGKGAKLHDSDRKSLGKAISGFGNSEGGVIVWGINCQGDREDLPDKAYPIDNPKRFASKLEGISSGCTIPPHRGVRHQVIECEGSNTGFVITLIEKSSDLPHQCITAEPHRILVRVGSSFAPAPYSLLAGMFGRTPSPSLDPTFLAGSARCRLANSTVSPIPSEFPRAWLNVLLINTGSVLATDIYTTFTFRTPGDNCLLHLGVRNHNFAFHEAPRPYGGFSGTSLMDFRLAPGAIIEPFSVIMGIAPPFERDFEYELIYGCAGAPVRRTEVIVPAERFRELHAAFLPGPESADQKREQADLRNFAASIFDIYGVIKRLQQNY